MQQYATFRKKKSNTQNILTKSNFRKLPIFGPNSIYSLLLVLLEGWDGGLASWGGAINPCLSQQFVDYGRKSQHLWPPKCP